MKPLINLLIQVQDLYEARAQQEALAPNARTESIDESIEALLKRVPDEFKQQFLKLQKKGQVSIVPIFNHVCSGCGMGIPVSLTQSVKAAEGIYNCPNCTRLLYVPAESRPRRVPQRTRKYDGPVDVGIARFSSPNLMIPEMEATTRDEAIAEMCAKLEEENFVDDGDKLLTMALKREAIASTAVDHGLAFPHVRGIEGGGLALALGISKKGIRFSDESRNLTRVIFFVSIPTAASAFYLKLLAGLTQSFREKKHRDKLLAADTPKKLWKALVSTTKSTIK